MGADAQQANAPVAANGDNATRAQKQHVRFATFNVSFFGKSAGDLARELSSGKSESAARIAEVIQRMRPDVILLNEFDYDEAGKSLAAFREKFLQVGQNGQEPINFPHTFFGPVNTGVDSGLDLNKDQKLGTPDDAYGFGQYPGQYGMVVLSKFPLGDSPRTFQKFLWKDMPGASWPVDPNTGEPYYSEEIRKVFRLSSKSHWDIPIVIGTSTVHLLTAHPTPPVFDGAEDRNGCRNHDEIRLIADYIAGADYIYDDQGKRGGLEPGSMFVIAGDMNADPNDGASRDFAARQFTENPLINTSKTPHSNGALAASKSSGGANEQQTGDPAADTGDFNDRSVGNLHIDYVLPSKNLSIVDCGVFWPAPGEPGAELADASDHHLVWVDVEF